MTYSIDKFFNRVYSADYNCLAFVREVWQDMTGVDVLKRLPWLLDGKREGLGGINGFRRLESPVSPCIAVFQRKGATPHVGIFLDGRILHIHERGVEFQPLIVAKTYFRRVQYYA